MEQGIIKQQTQASLTQLRTELMTILNAEEVRESYNDEDSLIRSFSPLCHYDIIKNEHNVWFGAYPTLVTINNVYPETAERLVNIMLEDLEIYICANKKFDETQYIQLSQIIVSEFYFLKISELILFFWRVKSGHYGKFYGQIDPLNLIEWLRNFVYEYRWNAINADIQKIEDAYEQWHSQNVVKDRNLGHELPNIMKAISDKATEENAEDTENPDLVQESALALVNNTANLSPEDLMEVCRVWKARHGCNPYEFVTKNKKEG